eukprot:3108861-Prymnesium_polylepis.1
MGYIRLDASHMPGSTVLTSSSLRHSVTGSLVLALRTDHTSGTRATNGSLHDAHKPVPWREHVLINAQLHGVASFVPRLTQRRLLFRLVAVGAPLRTALPLAVGWAIRCIRQC